MISACEVPMLSGSTVTKSVLGVLHGGRAFNVHVLQQTSSAGASQVK